ncbi:MAG: 50S ribosomal protein L17 [Candidatus Magasanikbacteria bacterium]|jgi:large subunit ribosomal protein L17|nr:50S ribosomal protein L17 [Candidatus Magasanikbacteria bacterium]
MRHQVQKFTLGRQRAERKALLRNLAESLVVHGAIKTTEAKAKALRTVVEPLVTRAKRGTLADRRQIAKVLFTEDAIRKIMHDIAPKYKERPGGYTRIIRMGHRPTDGADVVRIEFV